MTTEWYYSLLFFLVKYFFDLFQTFEPLLATKSLIYAFLIFVNFIFLFFFTENLILLDYLLTILICAHVANTFIFFRQFLHFNLLFINLLFL